MRFHFDCTSYYVSNLDRAVAFYSDVLGFKLKSRDVAARFDVDGVMFEVVPTHDRSLLQGTGNGRFCLRVEDMSRAITDLKQRGVPVTESRSKPGGLLASLRDPDGNEIGLWQYE
jgi:catechol 2,3-dioxygenase-like lactoylglutathione lyase family enzyme